MYSINIIFLRYKIVEADLWIAQTIQYLQFMNDICIGAVEQRCFIYRCLICKGRLFI